MEFSVRCLSPPNTYSYVQEENLGLTRKSVEIYSICVLPTTLTARGLEELFFCCLRKVPLAHAQQVYSISCQSFFVPNAEKPSQKI